MDKEEQHNLDRLYEALSIERTLVDAMSPYFQGYGGNPRWWNCWGGPYPVHSLYNPKGVMDIKYVNTEGVLHRIYGPAYESKLYNIQAWFKNGVMHREDGPAYIHGHNMVWFYEGKLHRLDGPAVLEGGGPKQYWIMGQKMSQKEYKKEITRRRRKGLIK